MAAPSTARRHDVISADGTVIALERVTDGPRPVVTFPGATAPRDIWAPAAAALDGRFAVWLADRRGKGDSGDVLPYALEREYEDVRAAAAWFGGDAVIAGHSSGAVAVLGAAAAGDLPAASLVVYEPPWPLPGREDNSATLDAMEARIAAGDPQGALEIGVLELVQALPAALAGMKQAPSWPRRVAAAHTWPREVRALLAMPLGTDALHGVGPHTVMLLGTSSAEHLRASTFAVADALADAVVVDLPGQGHTALQAAPALVAEAILAHVT